MIPAVNCTTGQCSGPPFAPAADLTDAYRDVLARRFPEAVAVDSTVSSDRHWRVLFELHRREDAGLAAPTIRELQALLGCSSTSLVTAALNRLKGEGLVTWEAGLARTLHLTDAGRWAVQRQQAGV